MFDKTVPIQSCTEYSVSDDRLVINRTIN